MNYIRISLITILSIQFFTGCSGKSASINSSSSFQHELQSACEQGNGVLHVDNQTFNIKLDIQKEMATGQVLGALGSVLTLSTLGVVPFCPSRDVSISTNIGSSTYNFKQRACQGWLAWSLKADYAPICKTFIKEYSDQVLYDLKDQGYIE